METSPTHRNNWIFVIQVGRISLFYILMKYSIIIKQCTIDLTVTLFSVRSSGFTFFLLDKETLKSNTKLDTF